MQYSFVFYITVIFCVAILAFFIFMFSLIIRALLKYIHSNSVQKEMCEIRKSLSESLKQHCNQCNMTLEFVAESIGVSRQAVSKWENGSSDPST